MPRHLPSFTALRVFEAAARLKSFKSAAEELHVTPAAVSRQIKELERTLGFPLFERRNRGVTISDRGFLYAEIISRAFNDLESGTTELIGSTKNGRRLTLLVEREFATRWLSPNLSSFSERQPNVDVEIVPITEITALPTNGPRCAISYGEFVQPGVRLEHLLTLIAFPVCSPGFLKGMHPLREPDDLVHYRLLHDRSTNWWKRWLAEAGAAAVNWSAGHVFHESSLAIEAALGEEGVAMGDNLLALRELEDGRLVKPFAHTCRSGSYFLATWRNTALDLPLEQFREWLLTLCAKQQLHCDQWQ